MSLTLPFWRPAANAAGSPRPP